MGLREERAAEGQRRGFREERALLKMPAAGVSEESLAKKLQVKEFPGGKSLPMDKTIYHS